MTQGWNNLGEFSVSGSPALLSTVSHRIPTMCWGGRVAGCKGGMMSIPCLLRVSGPREGADPKLTLTAKSRVP